MSQPKPFHRNYRGFVDGLNSGYSQWAYIVDNKYAVAPEHYVRAFLIIQSDLETLLQFVEPADENLSTYSYRIHELLVRTCIEIEANFKAILKENTFSPTVKEGKRKGKPRFEKHWNIHDYRKVNKSHHLSAYKVHVPIWDGTHSVLMPFHEWTTSSELSWYQAYNSSKHDRQQQFKKANFQNLLSAVSGLVALLSSQFRTEDFSPGLPAITGEGNSYYHTEPALGGFFHIEFPNDWSDDEKYDFDWSELKNDPHRFQKFDYNTL